MEAYAKEIGDLGDPENPELDKILLEYTGNSKIILDFPDEQNSLGLKNNIITIIKNELESQRLVLKRIRKIEQDFFVWISKENQILVSLASFDRIKNNYTSFTAYHEYPIQGILGRLEKKVYDVIFISPFWIWSEDQI